jgi:hypothetical protein
VTELTRPTEAKGFIASLYDFKFTSLITGRFIRFIYKLLVILVTIGFVVAALAVIAKGGAVGLLLVVVLIPLYFLYLIYLRMGVEFIIVFFQIGDDLRAVRLHITGSAPSSMLSAGAGGLPVFPGAASSGAPGISAGTTSTVAAPAGATPAGWYDAPGDPTRRRYWDGTAWTEHFSPK